LVDVFVDLIRREGATLRLSERLRQMPVPLLLSREGVA